MKPKTHKKIDKWQHFQQSCVPVQKVVPVPVPQICTGILHWCTALPTFTPSLPKQNCQTLSPLNLYDTGSFLPAATNLSSYNTATLACRRVWQCCMNRGLQLAGRNEFMYFEVGSERVKQAYRLQNLFLSADSFLPAATNLCSYNTAMLVCRLACRFVACGQK